MSIDTLTLVGVENSKCSAIQKIRDRWVETNCMAGVGIDPIVELIPSEIWSEVGRDNIGAGIATFGKRIIDATAHMAVDYKINSSFFKGAGGRAALYEIFSHLKTKYPKVIRICDGKFGDVGHTAEIIASEIFDDLDADAVLLNPYLGWDAIRPFVERPDKIAIICISTSNPSAGDLHNLKLENGQPLWRFVLEKSFNDWNKNGNIVPVLSATHPDQLADIRSLIGDAPILLAGIGSQGGSLSCIPQLIDSKGFGLVISSSRGIIYADRNDGESFQEASARKLVELNDSINRVKTQG